MTEKIEEAVKAVEGVTTPAEEEMVRREAVAGKVHKDVKDIRHKKFKLLPFYSEIVSMFENGASLREVANKCRAAGYFVDESDNTLLSGLSRFRSDEITGWNKAPAQKRAKAKKDNPDLIDPTALTKVSTSEELDRLYKLQLGRVNMALKFERKMRVLNKNIVREIEAATSILTRKHEVEGGSTTQSNIDLTVRPEIELKLPGAEHAKKALENPESASRVLSVAKSLARLGLGQPTEGGTIDVLTEEADDGDHS
jgi:hypothetical protein